MTGFTYGDTTGALHGTEHGGSYGSISDPTLSDASAFAYGTVNGAVYGTSDGGTYGESLPWVIDGRVVHVERDSIELTPRTLTLAFEVDRQEIDHWRQYNRTGDINVRVRYGGEFRAIDNAGRVSPVTITPPLRDQPPFTTGAFYPNSYQETQPAVDRFRVTIVFQRLEPRHDVFDPIDETGGDWRLELDRGTIAFDVDEERVRQTMATGSTAGGTIMLPVTLTDMQAALLIDTAGFPDAVVQRSPADAPNRYEDVSADHQTVQFETPAESAIESGEYLLAEWRLDFSSFAVDRWAVELQLR